MTDTFIHPQAHVDADCKIGGGTKVWQFASITRGSAVGVNCVVAPCAVLDGVILGSHSHVMSGVFLAPGVEVGFNVFIGPNASFCNDAWPRVDPENWDKDEFKDKPCTIIRNCASIGAAAVVLPGVHVGEGAMVAAGAVVTRDVLPWHLWPRNGGQQPIDDEAGRMRRRMRFAATFPIQDWSGYPRPVGEIS